MTFSLRLTLLLLTQCPFRMPLFVCADAATANRSYSIEKVGPMNWLTRIPDAELAEYKAKCGFGTAMNLQNAKERLSVFTELRPPKPQPRFYAPSHLARPRIALRMGSLCVEESTLQRRLLSLVILGLSSLSAERHSSLGAMCSPPARASTPWLIRSEGRSCDCWLEGCAWRRMTRNSA